MKYTSKDVCKLYNIKRDTLRYYEKIGLIHPEIDATNKYRYYDDWDINYIGECKKYQSLGLSIKEVSDIFEKGTLASVIEKSEEKQRVFEQKLNYYTLLLQHNQQYITRLKMVSEYLNQFTITKSSSIYFLPYREQFQYDLSNETLKILHSALDNYSFFDNTVYIRKEDFKKGNNMFSWGVSIQEEYLKYLSVPHNGMQLFPQRDVLYTVIDAGERWNFGYQLFEPSIEFLHTNGYIINGDIYGNLLTRVFANKKYCRYIEIFIPVNCEQVPLST